MSPGMRGEGERRESTETSRFRMLAHFFGEIFEGFFDECITESK
jgi:hypothetical protein